MGRKPTVYHAAYQCLTLRFPIIVLHHPSDPLALIDGSIQLWNATDILVDSSPCSKISKLSSLNYSFFNSR